MPFTRKKALVIGFGLSTRRGMVLSGADRIWNGCCITRGPSLLGCDSWHDFQCEQVVRLMGGLEKS